MSHNDDEFSMANLKSNLKKAEHLCDRIGYNNIIKKAHSNPGHIAKMFGIPNDPYQNYLESLFQTLKYYDIKYPNPTRKFNEDLVNPDKDYPTLAEIEVAAKLAPYFKITPEYPIAQSKSNLDLLIEDKSSGEKALIEIATSPYDYASHADANKEAEVRYSGGKGSKGNKIKNALDKKLKKQLKNLQNAVINGKVPLECPLIILFKIDTPFDINSFFNNGEIKIGLYAEEFTSKDEDNNIVYRQVGFYHEENIEFISKIGTYKLDWDYLNKNYRIDGIFYEPLKTPQRKMSSEFEQKLEKALFQYFTNWIEKSFSFIPISKYFSLNVRNRNEDR